MSLKQVPQAGCELVAPAARPYDFLVKLYVLGVGDTFSEKHTTHSLLLEHDGFKLAIDCPDSYRRVLRQARDKAGGADALDLFAIDDFLITHIHGDHMNGLEGVGYFKLFAQKKPANLHTIAPVKDGLWERRLKAPMGQLIGRGELAFEDYYAWNELSTTSHSRVGPFEIEARITKHHVPTSALFVRCGGSSIGISSDTAFDPSLIEWLARADVIVHETNYGPAHTAYSDLLGLDAAVKSRMRLIHYPDEFDIAKSEIPCLWEGQVVAL
jgi:ribonuclease BN (tRNA processing enzyme)